MQKKPTAIEETGEKKGAFYQEVSFLKRGHISTPWEEGVAAGKIQIDFGRGRSPQRSSPQVVNELN